MLRNWYQTTHGLLFEDEPSRRTQFWLLGAVVAACFAVRVSTITTPQIDRTSWKEIDYLTISHNYWQHGFQFAYPEVTWPAEGSRVTAMELPVVPYIAAICYELGGFNEYSARALTLASFMAIIVYVFLLSRREFSGGFALVAAMTAGVMPLCHPFGKMLFSEPLVIACSVASIFHWLCWMEDVKRRHLVAAGIAFTLAVAMKLTPLYLLLPITHIAVREFGVSFRSWRAVGTFTAACLILPIAWYAWAYHLAQTHIDVFGVFGGRFGGHDKFQTVSMLSSASWYQTIGERLLFQILGGKVGALLLGAGAITLGAMRCGGVWLSYLLAIFAFFVLVAEGQIDAPYRQLTIIPPLSLVVAAGVMAIVAGVHTVLRAVFARPRLSMRWAAAMAPLLVFAMPARNLDVIFGWPASKPVSRTKWDLAHHIQHYTDGDAKLAVLGEYTIHKGGNDVSPVLYYYANRQGWTLLPADWSLATLERLRASGATHFVATSALREPKSFPFLRDVAAQYTVLHKRNGEMIADLTRPKSGGRPTSLNPDTQVIEVNVEGTAQDDKSEGVSSVPVSERSASQPDQPNTG